MMTLPIPEPVAGVLSLDFDGTLHDPASRPPVPDAFFERVRRLRDERRIVWGINTGRSMHHLAEGFLESRFPFLPDWAVAREREIYFPNHFGRWIPHSDWNRRCEKEVHGLFKHARKLLSRIRHEIEQHSGARWLEMDGEPAGLIARTEEEMEWIITHITPLAAAEPTLAWQRNSIWLRFGHRDFHKGSSLAEIARFYQLPAAACFAMGDGHNDLEMLDPACAGMTACPANAVPEVRQHITSTGGLVTRAVHGAGVVEALDHYFS
jgi:hydroxymethylpyrimidine pyrophosphatase-like HAD family hydrolase